jgi:hypothetical protein
MQHQPVGVAVDGGTTVDWRVLADGDFAAHCELLFHQ